MSDPIAVLFCGSRGWTNRELIRTDILALPTGSIIITGRAQGADHIARVEATVAGYHIADVPALWAHYGRGAGHKRNAAMLLLAPAIVYAYNLGTPGTTGMVALAKAAGIEVIERG